MPALVGAGVDEQPMQPGIESFGVAKPGQVAPGVDEGLLHGVLGHGHIAKDQPSDREEPVAGVDRKRLEGVVITTLRCLDEGSIHSGVLRRDRIGRVCTLRRISPLWEFKDFRRCDDDVLDELDDITGRVLEVVDTTRVVNES